MSLVWGQKVRDLKLRDTSKGRTHPRDVLGRGRTVLDDMDERFGTKGI